MNAPSLVCLNRIVNDKKEQVGQKGGDGVALGLAAGWVIIRHRPYRRNLLFGLTLVTLLMVFLGAAPLTAVLSQSPFAFAVYWIACFFLVGFVLLLAIYDLIAIRQEHRQRMNRLEQELSEAAEEARQLAEAAKKTK